MTKMYNRPNGHTPGTWKGWTTVENKWLEDNWDLFSYTKDMVPYLPGRTLYAIIKQGEHLGLKRMSQGRTRSRIALDTWWALQKKPMTKLEVIAELGCSESYLRGILSAFLASKAVYISHWVKQVSGGPWVRVYAAGDGLNKKRPPATGKRRTTQVMRLKRLGDNPFSLLVDMANHGETEHDNAEYSQDVCTR